MTRKTSKICFCNNTQVKGYLEDGLDEALQGCDVVVVPAGVPRKPGQYLHLHAYVTLPCVYVTTCVGMTRDDLFNTNASIVQKLAEAAARYAK